MLNTTTVLAWAQKHAWYRSRVAKLKARDVEYLTALITEMRGDFSEKGMNDAWIKLNMTGNTLIPELILGFLTASRTSRNCQPRS